ncbi:hypothetical protein ACTPEF_24960, partial [Clostridioides difficile]
SLIDMGYSCVKPNGTFYLFPKAPIEDDKKFCNDAKQFNLLLVPYDTAIKMISTIDFNLFKKTDTLSILEPSAGCGILVATLVES